MNDLTFCIPILLMALNMKITVSLVSLLTLFLAYATIILLLIPLLGTGNNVVVVVKAAAAQQLLSPSLSSSLLSYRYANGDNSSSIMNSSSLPPLYSQQQQLLLPTTPPPEIFDRVKSSVVQITPLPSSQGQNASLLGSGFVYDREGHILTNDHVVRDAASVVVTLVDGNQYNSNVIGKDPINDIAVLK
jgi:S1-C subfamily serine protease